jgi:hypothetical protein
MTKDRTTLLVLFGLVLGFYRRAGPYRPAAEFVIEG